jgi:murein DD-endopeptidase MepM/ murein hydrolase activator NlpD
VAALVALVGGVGAADAQAEPAPLDLDAVTVTEPLAPAARNPVADIRRLLRPEASILLARERLEQDLEARSERLVVLRVREAAMTVDRVFKQNTYDAETRALGQSRDRIRLRLAALAHLERQDSIGDALARASWPEVEARQSARARVARADRTRVAAYRDLLEAWRARGVDLARRIQNLERTRRAIVFVTQELTWDREEYRALTDAVVKEPEFYAAYGAEIEKLDAEMQALVRGLAAKAPPPSERPRLYIAETKGGLSVPLRGADLAAGFGQRIHNGVKSTWRGIELVPLRDAPRVEVRAIYWGYVAWAGWIRGLGRVVILDHTLGFYSIYGHLAAVTVPLGQKVRTGEPIGLLGDTESFFGRRLYLELRKDGVAVDPMPWFR